MFTTVIKKVIGTKNEKVLKKLQPLVEEINALEPTLEKLNDNELKAKTGEFKERIEKGESLDAILPEA
ncbi:MAG: hypothetical protein JRI87_03615, partial [Deltaproteobacteria bacterium]|nr:hypothetical protein [Deltaproteobacteria bacterium]